ncbi:disks large-associated protein 5-like [Uloborus diversus]|uniref:disks large-associated protein 5-like n=1 Tax=Uloborus diversus TaxID=327109 RepID=UPI002409206F|nr:disks large-associated protein 5-like [Uloborus diversus]
MGKTTLHFRNLLTGTVQNLENTCAKWEVLSTEHKLSEEVLGEIRTAIGLTKLLLNQKLKQFSGLIDDSEFKRSEKEVTCMDLEGFWDMVSFEVEKILKTFSELEKRKMNNWEVSNETANQPAVTKKLVRPINMKRVAVSKSLASAARQRIAEAKQKMRQQQLLNQNKSEFVVEIAQPPNQHHHTNAVVSNENSTLNIPQVLESENKESSKLCSEKEISKPEDILNTLKEANIKNSVRTSKKSTKDNKIDIFGKENKLSVPRSKGSTKVTEGNKENPSVPSILKDSKVRDHGKLQCITRSVARAMLAEKNSH